MENRYHPVRRNKLKLAIHFRETSHKTCESTLIIVKFSLITFVPSVLSVCLSKYYQTQNVIK